MHFVGLDHGLVHLRLRQRRSQGAPSPPGLSPCGSARRPHHAWMDQTMVKTHTSFPRPSGPAAAKALPATTGASRGTRGPRPSRPAAAHAVPPTIRGRRRPGRSSPLSGPAAAHEFPETIRAGRGSRGPRHHRGRPRSTRSPRSSVSHPTYVARLRGTLSQPALPAESPFPAIGDPLSRVRRLGQGPPGRRAACP